MKLRPLPGFIGNGVLKGTIVALDEADEPLGWEHRGNWSSIQERKKATDDLAEFLGISRDTAAAAIGKAMREARREVGIGEPEEPAESAHDLPVVVVTNRQLRDIVDECWRVLVAANADEPRIFRYGGQLADVVDEGDGLRARVMSVPALSGHLTRNADFVAVRRDGETAARPPEDAVKVMLALQDPELPRLVGIVRSPVVAPDGEIIATEGYHRETCLMVRLARGLVMPVVPREPTADDLDRARHLLVTELLGDFPFQDQASLANAVAAALGPVVRPLVVGPAPLHLFDAPMSGTGKGLLAEMVAYIATGESAAVMPGNASDQEWRKRITAQLARAPQIILFDNINQTLDSGNLAAAITAPDVWTDRIIGQSEMKPVPVRVTWIATGNNVAVSGEWSRRVVLTRLDAQMERPWEGRAYRHPNLSAWVRAHRPELLWALLTMVRAWVAAGRPGGDEKMQDFPSWSAVLGGILKVAGIEGFLRNRGEMYQAVEDERANWYPLLEAWWGEYGDKAAGVEKLYELAAKHKLLSDLRRDRSDKGARTAMGMALASMRDRVFGRFRIRRAGEDTETRAKLYRLETCDSEKGYEGYGGYDSQIGASPEPSEPSEPFSLSQEPGDF